jgi:hypothetical protein
MGGDDLGKERNDDGEAQNQWRRGEMSLQLTGKE